MRDAASWLARAATRCLGLWRNGSIVLFGLAWGVGGISPARAQVPEAATAEAERPRELADLVESAEEPAPDLGYRFPWLDMIGQSAFGPLRPERWRPLGLGNFFEGWDEPYAPVPSSGVNGAPRQTWINNADGAFYRLFVFSFSYAYGMPGHGTGYAGDFFLFTPFSRRFEVGWFFPFVNATPNLLKPSGTPYSTAVGDLTVAPRILLAEDRRYTFTTNLYVRLPTGSIRNGNGIASLSPDIEFWANPIDRFVVRGAVGVTVPTNETAARLPYLVLAPFSGINGTPGAFTSFDARLAVGQYITPPDARLLPDFVYYLASDFHTQLSGGNATYFSLTPGFRFGVGNDWYFLGGIEVPLVGPLPFQTQTTFQLIKNF